MVENKAGKIRERWEKRGGCAISQGVVRKGLTDKVALEQILEAARCAGMWGDDVADMMHLLSPMSNVNKNYIPQANRTFVFDVQIISLSR